MLLATLVVLFQFPLASAGKLPAPPQATGRRTVRRKSPGEADSRQPSATIPFAPPATNRSLRPRQNPSRRSSSSQSHRPRMANRPTARPQIAPRLPRWPAPTGRKLLAPSRSSHPHTRTEPPDPNFRPAHIDAERPSHTWLALSISQARRRHLRRLVHQSRHHPRPHRNESDAPSLRRQPQHVRRSPGRPVYSSIS